MKRGWNRCATKRILMFGALLVLFVQFTQLVRLPIGLQVDHSFDSIGNGLIATIVNASNSHHGACSGYDGVLHIAQGDREGAAGTIFFLFVLNQLLYADMYNLIPWVYLNNVSRYVYDPQVHEANRTQQSLQVVCGKTASWMAAKDHISNRRFRFPGKPQGSHLTKCMLRLQGNGVWESYFERVSEYDPNNFSCQSLPMVRLTYAQILPGLHVHAPWSLRAWRYGGLPPSLLQMDKTYDEWFAPMRRQGHVMVEKYVQFLPYLRQHATEQHVQSQCLALHIRHSDKANRRKRIQAKQFLPYVEAYFRHQTRSHHPTTVFSIYLATDSTSVIDEIQQTWPREIVTVMRWQHDVVRSNDTTAVFKQNFGHHRTNVEVLTDIIVMSQCQYFLHGLSAVSESVHYLNPGLKYSSVNLEVSKKEIVSLDRFREMLYDCSTKKCKLAS